MTSSEELKFDAEFMAQAIKIAIENSGNLPQPIRCT